MVTINPNASSLGSWSVVGAANAHSALSDANDGTYVSGSGTGSSMSVDFESNTLPSGALAVNVKLVIRYKFEPTIGFFQDFLAPLSDVGDTWTNLTIPAVTKSGFNQSELNSISFSGYKQGNNGRIARAYITYDVANKPDDPTFTGPSSTVTGTRKPVINWNHNAGSGGGGQSKYQVKVFSAAQYGAGGFSPGS